MEQSANTLVKETIKLLIDNGQTPTLSNLNAELTAIIFKTLTAPKKDWIIRNGEMILRETKSDNYPSVNLPEELKQAHHTIEKLNEQVTSLMSQYQQSINENQQQVAKDSQTIKSLQDELALITECFEEIMVANEKKNRLLDKKNKVIMNLEKQLTTADVNFQRLQQKNNKANQRLTQLLKNKKSVLKSHVKTKESTKDNARSKILGYMLDNNMNTA